MECRRDGEISGPPPLPPVAGGVPRYCWLVLLLLLLAPRRVGMAARVLLWRRRAGMCAWVLPLHRCPPSLSVALPPSWPLAERRS